MPKPSTPAVWASGKTFGFQPSVAQQAQGFDYIATVRPTTGAPITDDHDWPLNSITTSLKWVMDQLPNGGVQQLLTELLPKRSFAANDRIRIPDVPNGLMIQFGVIPSVSGTDVVSATITFPELFPTACLAVIASATSPTSGGGQCFVQVKTITNASADIFVVERAGGAIQPHGVRYIAIGW